LDDILGVELERGLQRLAEGHRLGGDHMHQRTALHAGEDRRVDLLGEFLVIGEDHAAARTAQRLVRRGGHDMRMRERRRMRATGLNHLPDRLIAMPWLRWPPAARLSPMKVSPGCISAKKASALAEAPECGCTLANAQPNSLVTRSIASFSAISTN